MATKDYAAYACAYSACTVDLRMRCTRARVPPGAWYKSIPVADSEGSGPMLAPARHVPA